MEITVVQKDDRWSRALSLVFRSADCFLDSGKEPGMYPTAYSTPYFSPYLYLKVYQPSGDKYLVTVL